MKRLLTFFIVAIMIVSVSGCARKENPDIKIKYDSVSSISFKRTVFAPNETPSLKYFEKQITNEEDVRQLVNWIESLSITKHEAIEVPSEKIEYLMKFGDTKEHTLIFFEDYVVYDSTAYTFDNTAQKTEVVEKYNMLNYEEKQTELDLY